MLNGKRIAVVMPAYNAERTLQATVDELPEIVDIRILVDDSSADRTVEVARELGLVHFVHDRNYGYGRNQQTCYTEALAEGADVVIMVHHDYQYTPRLVTAGRRPFFVCPAREAGFVPARPYVFLILIVPSLTRSLLT